MTPEPVSRVGMCQAWVWVASEPHHLCSRHASREVELYRVEVVGLCTQHLAALRRGGLWMQFAGYKDYIKSAQVAWEAPA